MYKKTSLSDTRLKKDIKLIKDPMDKLSDISGVIFNWEDGFDNIHPFKGNDVGVLAQDVQQTLPEAVIVNKDNGFMEVNYEKLIPLLIESIKELKNRIQVLEKK